MKFQWVQFIRQARVLFIFATLSGFKGLFAQQPKLMLPIGHTDAVVYAQFSPDGNRVVTASNDKTAKIWDVASGSLLADLRGHTDVVTYVEFSPDGKKLITVSGSIFMPSQDSSVRVWDAFTGNLLAELKHNSQAVSARFSPNGKRILTAAKDNHAHLWDAGTFKKLFTLTKHKQTVNAAQYSSDGKKIITASSDQTAIIWDAESGISLGELKGRNLLMMIDAFLSRDGKKAITIHKHRIFQAQIWDAVADTIINKYPLGDVSFAQFSPDNKLVLTTSASTIAVLWDASTGNAVKSLLHDGKVRAARFSPDGKKIVTASEDGSCKIWDTEKLRGTSDAVATDTLEGHDDWVWYAQFSPDGKKIVSASTDGTARVWSAKDGISIAELKGHTTNIGTAQISPDGKLILTASYNGAAKIWDARNGTLLKNMTGFGGLYAAEFSADGKKIITASADSIPRIWDADAGIVLKELPRHNHEVLSGQFSNDGTRIATTSKDKLARVWDAINDSLLFELKYHSQQVNTGRFSRDGNRIVTASSDNTAAIWDANNGNLVKVLKGHTYFVTYADFNPDGKRIVTASWDRTVRIWNAESGEQIAVLTGHRGPVQMAKYSDDGTKVLSASEDGTVKIWDANSFVLLDNLQVDSYGVNSARFSPDGNKIITTSWSNTCKLWDAGSKQMLFTFFPVDSVDYLVTDKEYRYDGTQAARDLLYFTCGTEIIQLSQVKDQLWVPGLAEMILKGERIHSKTLYQLGICGYTPETKNSETTTNEYRFKIKPRGGGLGETVVSVNGIETKRYKPNEIKNRNGEFEVVIRRNELDSFLIPGQQNAVTVRSFARDQSISSRGAGVTVDNATTSKPSNLYALVVGVSDYKGDSIDLNFAAKDAVDISNALGITARKYLNTDGKEHVFIYKLTTTADRYRMPDKRSVKAMFDTIGRKATANDIVLIFFAGHGTMMGRGANQQFYFLTSDAYSLKATNSFKTVAISTSELMEWMKPQKVKAQKRVLVFDACSSGQAIADFTNRNFVTQGGAPAQPNRSQQIKTIDKLNEKSGFFILSASASGKDAYEIPKYAQGLLTYSLLKSIKTNPEVLEDNKYLNIGRWFTVTEKIVTDLIKENGAEQQPQIVSHNNFSIGVVDNEVIGKINLAADRPLFKASSFLNKAIPIDDFEFSTMVDVNLNYMSVRGGTKKITYSSATLSPDAFRLNGHYEFVGDSVKVTAFILQRTSIKHEFTLHESKTKLKELAVETANRAAEWSIKQD